MNCVNVEELYYIIPISNLESIMNLGILAHNRAKKIGHESIAMQIIQEKRAKKTVPGGRFLHDYVNLYFSARNPMMFKRKDQHQSICVLKINNSVLDLPDTVIADGNASSEYTRFWPSPMGLSRLNWDLITAEYWTDDNIISQWRKASVKCAELLIPDRLDPSYIVGADVSCEQSELSLRAISFSLPIIKNSNLFFR